MSVQVNTPIITKVGRTSIAMVTDATDQLTLNNLLIEHCVITTVHLQALYDKKDTSTSAKLLNDNGKHIGDFLESKYGVKAKEAFIPMWQKHILLYENYTRAIKGKDTVAEQDAKNQLSSLANDMGTFFNKLDGNFTPETVTSLMNDHINVTLSIIDAYARHDQATMVKQIKAGTDQAARFASYLTQPTSLSPTVSY